MRCPQCDGEGTRTFYDLAYGRGSGHGAGGVIRRTEQCLSCRGTGKLGNCPKCNGDVEIDVLCDLCHGTREVSESVGKQHKRERIYGCIGCVVLLIILLILGLIFL